MAAIRLELLFDIEAPLVEAIERTVFISYRRANFPWALLIFKDLTEHGYRVFFDYDGVASGDFERVILENIRARAHFLLLLTPSALERCEDPTDWLRREIETALTHRRNIVPLMLEGFDFHAPTVKRHLTGKLTLLEHYNSLNVPREYFWEAMGRLRDKYLNVPLTAVPHPASPVAECAAAEQEAAAMAAPVVLEEELNAQHWFEQAFVRRERNEFGGAVDCLNEAIRLKPDFAWAFCDRAEIRQAQGDLERALRDYNEAIRLQPDFAGASYLRGVLRQMQGNGDGALQDFNEAIRLKPDFPEALAGRGIERYNKTRSSFLDWVEDTSGRSIVRREHGELDGALQDMNEAIRLYPDFAEAFLGRAMVRHDQGDLEGALQDLNETIRLKPSLAEAFYKRGAQRREIGDFEGALQDLNEAIRLKPTFADAFYMRYLVRYRKGNLKGALLDYYKAIGLDFKQKYLK